jgi:hypothetical protein
MTPLRIAIAACLVSLPLAAQWLKQPTLGIPRTPDGKPDLTASAPRAADGHPDLSGLWRVNADSAAYSGNIVADLKPADILPAADGLYKQRLEDLGKDDPAIYQCLPQGPRALFGGMEKILQTPTLIAVLYEDLSYRQVHLDGRELPKDPNPSYMGYSVGHWDRDALVIESTGFNDRTWLDGGHPHSEALRITERLRRRDFGHLEVEETLYEPTVAAKPWTVTIKFDMMPDTEMLEYVCNENERDHAHLVGKASDDAKNAVKLAPEVLSKYTGAYEFISPEDPTFVMRINVTLSGDQLFVDIAGKDKLPMVPTSNTAFSVLGGKWEFFRDDQGRVTHLIAQAAEGDMKAVRKGDAPGGNN